MNRRQTKPIGTAAQRAAILRLLEDDDAPTQRLVLGQLVSLGARGISEIEALIAMARPGPRSLLDAALRQALEGRRDARFRDRCARIETLAEFEEFCWQLADWIRPQARVAEARALLEEWGGTVRARLAPRLSEEARLGVLVSVLARQEGLGGNRVDYYNPANGLLDAVILSRRGLPLTLTAIYMFAGARAGLSVSGVAASAHFLARLGALCFDPYEAGRGIDQARWNGMIEGLSPAERARLLLPATYGAMAWRMVLNLVQAFERREDFAQVQRLSRIFEWLRRARPAGDPRSVGTGSS